VERAVAVAGGQGLDRPLPFWDDDGQAYLVHAFANSRAGKKNAFMSGR